VVALKETYIGPCSPACDRLPRSTSTVCDQFYDQSLRSEDLTGRKVDDMEFSNIKVFAAFMLVIACHVVLMEWNGPKLVEATDPVADGVPVKYVRYSRNTGLWSQRGVRSLLRGSRAASGSGMDLDPINDSSDLPSCIEICMVQNCYGAIPTANTEAPTTVS